MAAAVGSVLSWARVSTDSSVVDVRGTSSPQGTAVLVLGIGLVLVGFSLALAALPAPRRLVVAGALGLAVVALTLFVVGGQDRELDQGIRHRLETGFGPVNATEIRRTHEALVAAGLQTSFRFGVYLALAGGLAAVVGAAGSWGSSGRDERPPEQAGGPGYSGPPWTVPEDRITGMDS